MVYVNRPEHGVNQAKSRVLQPLVADGRFDYYETFDRAATSVSDGGRYEDVPPVAPVSSEAGEAIVESRFEAMTQELERAATRIDAYFDDLDGDYSDLWATPDNGHLRDGMWTVGKYRGWRVTLYDGHGRGIRDRTPRDDVLADVPDGLTCYVVPADVYW